MLRRGSWVGDVLILVCDLPLRIYKEPAACTLRNETRDSHIWFGGSPPPLKKKKKAVTKNT